MGQFPHSFEVYGFIIEVHAGGRRVWPPSFKRFVRDKLDNGELSVGQVMKTCNVSQSLVYKWRADVKRAVGGRVSVREERMFSEIVIEEPQEIASKSSDGDQIVLRGHEIEISLPATYPVDDLVKVILSLEGRT